MPVSNPVKDLGRLISTHATSPVYLQRAAVIAVVSFVFFLVMLVAFYIRQHIGYFALSTAFLVVYVFTLTGWVMQRRNTVSIYENGLKYKKFAAAWGDVRAVNADKSGLTITKDKREKTIIPSSVLGYDSIVRSVKQALEKVP